MDNFLYSVNATLPIFLVMILGKGLFKLGIINETFTKVADKYVYYVALPALVFKDLTGNNIRDIFNGNYVAFCFLVTLVIILSIWGLTELFMKDESQKGAFIQGAYRSSAAILGLAFVENMYSNAGMAPLMIVGAVPLFNIFAVIILNIKGNQKDAITFKKTALYVLMNPILLSILISLPFAFLDVHLPFFFTKSVQYVANTASPLALISIGATFEGKKAIKKIKPTMIAAFIKLFLLCGLFLPLAVYCGYRNQDLIGILIMLGSPTTVSCYVMAKNTNNDGILTSSIIVVTTFLSSISLTFWIFLLKSMGYL